MAKRARGRNSKYVDFINTFKDVTEVSSTSEFAKKCGKQNANMSSYLRGKTVPKKAALKSSLEHFFGWSVTPIAEKELLPSNLNSIPTMGGLYVFYDSACNLVYFGKATNLRTEIRQTLRRKISVSIHMSKKGKLQSIRPEMRDIVHYYSTYDVPLTRIRHNLEALFLRVFSNQTFNSNLGSFK